MPSQLTHVLSLSMPVGLVFSNSFLDGDAFMIALQQDCQRHGLRWEPSYSQPGLRETPLTPSDMRQLERLKANGLVVAISLGEHGRAYELVEHPFRDYAEPVLVNARRALAIRGPVAAELAEEESETGL